MVSQKTSALEAFRKLQLLKTKFVPTKPKKELKKLNNFKFESKYLCFEISYRKNILMELLYLTGWIYIMYWNGIKL